MNAPWLLLEVTSKYGPSNIPTPPVRPPFRWVTMASFAFFTNSNESIVMFACELKLSKVAFTFISAQFLGAATGCLAILNVIVSFGIFYYICYLLIELVESVRKPANSCLRVFLSNPKPHRFFYDSSRLYFLS